jgi:hypothetical protein
MSDADPIGPMVVAASQSLRDTAKWLVAGIVATAAGVFAGTSLTAFGTLNPLTETARFGAAIGGLLAGFAALGFILYSAVRVLTRESLSFAELLSFTDAESLKIKNILENRYKYMLPRGANTLADYVNLVDGAVRKEVRTEQDTALIAQAIKDNAVITADAAFLFVRQRFQRLIGHLWWTTPLAIVGFGLFAWAANPPKPIPVPPAFSLTIHGATHH